MSSSVRHDIIDLAAVNEGIGDVAETPRPHYQPLELGWGDAGRNLHANALETQPVVLTARSDEEIGDGLRVLSRNVDNGQGETRGDGRKEQLGRLRPFVSSTVLGRLVHVELEIPYLYVAFLRALPARGDLHGNRL